MKIDIALDYNLLKSGIRHYHTTDFEKSPHTMTIDGTGSGKTFLNKLYVGKIGLYNPNMKATVLDFKADDYHFARGSERLFEFEAVKNGLDCFYSEFLERQQGRDPDRSFRLLVVEEYGSILGYYDKKTGEEIKTKIANLIFLGRSFHIHVLISLQRPDASYFNSGVRDSISTVIALGNLSKEGKSMLFSGFQDQMTTNHSRGSGYMLVEGSKLYEIKVPTVNDVNKLEQAIIRALS